MSIDRASFVPLHAQLKNLFQRQIMAGDWAAGAPMPSESALCGMYGVSRITVRRALSDLEAEGLIRRERGRGTFVAATAPRRGPTLGLLFGGLTQRTFGHRNDTAFGDMVHGAAEAASRRGALVHPMPVGDGDLETMLATPTVFRLTGLLVHLIRMFTEDTLRLLDATGVPYVLIKRRVPPDRANSVYSDDVSGGEAVTHHLLSLGHRRVGLLLGPSEVGVWVDRAGRLRPGARAGGRECRPRPGEGGPVPDGPGRLPGRGGPARRSRAADCDLRRKRLHRPWGIPRDPRTRPGAGAVGRGRRLWRQPVLGDDVPRPHHDRHAGVEARQRRLRPASGRHRRRGPTASPAGAALAVRDPAVDRVGSGGVERPAGPLVRPVPIGHRRHCCHRSRRHCCYRRRSCHRRSCHHHANPTSRTSSSSPTDQPPVRVEECP